MNAKLTMRLLAATAVGGLRLTGCAATTTPYLDSRFGESVKAARALQTLNPDASLNTDPVAGVDARAAKSAMDQYHKSFETPPATFGIMNIGGAMSGGQ